jgi:predicted alpha/beta superfamily hydrolase
MDLNRLTCELLLPLVILTVVAAVSTAIAYPGLTDLGGGQYRVEFRYPAQAGTKTVHLAGTFNGWNIAAHPMDGPDAEGVFKTTLILPKGRHEYKFVINGRTWRTDPDNPYQTEGFRNAILYLGVEPPVTPSGEAAKPERADMAGELDHPQQIKDFIERLKEDSTAWMPTVKRWRDERPMPLFTDRSVTFVCIHDAADEVTVQIAAHGSRTGYRMHHLVDDRPVFAVTLDRSRLPDRMAYTFEVFRNEGRAETVIDPLAWSLTSRSGKPAALGIEASDQRGRIEVIRDVRGSSQDLPPRDVYVYLPPGYDKESERRYPVLYLHDGQNCWDDPVEPFGHGGWCVNLTADRLIHAGTIRPFIAVGVANTPDRMREYGPGPNILSDAEHAYIQLLKRDVKPLIDRRYRTLPDAKNTALMGSSLGGNISMQAALLNPATFGQAACLSPAFIFKDDQGADYFDLVRRVGKVPVRVYLDSGTAGEHQDGAALTRKMAALFRELGWKSAEDVNVKTAEPPPEAGGTDGVDFAHFEDAGAEHNERAWRARLEKPLVFLFGREPVAAQTQ